MTLKELLALIPDKILKELAYETEVDKYAKKLQGEVIFKLLLHCLISHKECSLRGMKSAYESVSFQMLNASSQPGSVAYSSISERLKSIEPEYFEKLYRSCGKLYKTMFENQTDSLIRFDSTIVSLSSKLIEMGYQLSGDASKVKQLKFSIGYTEIPEDVKLFYTAKYTSENAALKETVLEYSDTNSISIKVFDRGITSKDTYDE